MAIAYDATSEGSNASATSLTVAHTCTGSNRLLLTSVLTNNSTDIITSLKYNNVDCSELIQQLDQDNAYIGYVFGLLNPSTGANNLVIEFSAASTVGLQSISYTGVSQSGLPDATSSAGGIGNSWTASVTTTVDNCWHFLGIRTNSISTWTSGTRRLAGVFSGVLTTGDSNAPKTPAGVSSITGTTTNSSRSVKMSVSFAPATTGTTAVTPSGSLGLLGCGM